MEIKSDADTYERLPRQVKDYDRFFDYNYVVVGTSHAHHIWEHVPEYWDVITVEPDGKRPGFLFAYQFLRNNSNAGIGLKERNAVSDY